MLQQVLSFLLYLYSAFVDIVTVCENSEKLSASGLNRQEFPSQYFGTWHFIAAAAAGAGDPSLEAFATMDNTRFSIRNESEPGRLLLTARIRTSNGSCIPRKWIYLLTEGSTDLDTEGRADRRTELFSCACADCIILQESDPKVKRLLLYSRTPQLPDQCMKDFKKKASCSGLKEILLLPQTQEYCEFQWKPEDLSPTAVPGQAQEASDVGDPEAQ
ncbi:apolipoprotein M isoform X2 [Rhinatrema bivittatum]|uniref:apolipoprotein M isoform X2 n=1 Tax=Rhinatrema bivittatum TaxID=194408 RepID=UPI001126C490|nr:apolipoprotein M isoform X2 [Rhinatrema bivittatum]